MRNHRIIILFIAIPLLLIGCAHETDRQQDKQKAAFKRSLEENTHHCRKSIEAAELSNVKSKILWVSGLIEPTAAMQSDESFIQGKEKSEIKMLYKIIDFCQNMYRGTITLFINTEYGDQFQKHLHAKYSNLSDLNDGKIAYGTYNRQEAELSKRLIKDLQFLDERYRSQAMRQRALEPSADFQRSSNFLPAIFTQYLHLELIAGALLIW